MGECQPSKSSRYYVPEVGRFASPDTIVPDPGNPQSFNRYSYGLSNPVKYNDPTGHWFESVLDAAFIAYDIYDIQQNGLNWTNGLSLAADVGGLALPIVTGGGLAVRAAMHTDDAVDIARTVSRVEDVRHARTSAEIVQSVLNKINPLRFSETARFGEAFYVAEDGFTAVKELAAHESTASHVIRYKLDLTKAKVLDLTDPAIAKAWGYINDVASVDNHRQLAEKAIDEGYNAIKYHSFRGQGANYALLKNDLFPFNFDDWLIPQMVSPVLGP